MHPFARSYDACPRDKLSINRGLKAPICPSSSSVIIYNNFTLPANILVSGKKYIKPRSTYPFHSQPAIPVRGIKANQSLSSRVELDLILV